MRPPRPRRACTCKISRHSQRFPFSSVFKAYNGTLSGLFSTSLSSALYEADGIITHCCVSAGVFWGTLLFWLSLPARRKSTVSLHKGSHWPLPPLAGRPLAPLRAEWISPTPFPAALLNLTSGTAAISIAPPSGAGPTIPVACGGHPVAPRRGGSAALLQSAPSSRWIT